MKDTSNSEKTVQKEVTTADIRNQMSSTIQGSKVYVSKSNRVVDAEAQTDSSLMEPGKIEPVERIIIPSDSHWKGIRNHILEDLNLAGKFQVMELVKPGAKLKEVVDQTRTLEITDKDHVILLAGSNDSYNLEGKNILTYLRDIPLSNKVNEDIMILNIHMYEVSRKMKNTTFLDMTSVPGVRFTTAADVTLVLYCLEGRFAGGKDESQVSQALPAGPTLKSATVMFSGMTDSHTPLPPAP
ncbi:hypothetical protein J6590_009527 [Homalodisca vitripennis]|nr:hypothetical protein J6590_009527 [Homalodisca vitripennis]